MRSGKKRPPALAVATLMAFISLPAQEPINESVQVVNIEVIARVFAKGRAVGGLKKEEFTLLEDGKPVPINGFWEERQRMREKPVAATAPAIAAAARPGRLFVLYFWIYEPEVRWAEALDYFFSEIWRPGDRVLLCYGDKSVEIRDAARRDAGIAEFVRGFNGYLRAQVLERERLVRELDAIAEDYETACGGPPPGGTGSDLTMNPDTERNSAASMKSLADFNSLRMRYKSYLTQLRWAYLNVNEAPVLRFADSLRGIDAEKWVLVFSQREALPAFRPDGKVARLAVATGVAKEAKALFEDAERQFRMPLELQPYIQTFRSQAITARATFHLLLLSSKRSDDLGSDTVARVQGTSNWEVVCRDFSRDTGGEVADADRMRKALERVAAKEDVRYMLTYVPGTGDEERRLTLKVNRPGMQIVYARRARVAEEFPLSVDSVRFSAPYLEVDLSGYRRTFDGGALAGRVELSVATRDEKGGEQRWKSELRLLPERATISLQLRPAMGGRQHLIVKARDASTGKQARLESTIEATPPAAEQTRAEARKRKLPAPMTVQFLDALARAGAYCEKLKASAFRFVCDEHVQEARLERNPLSRNTQRLLNSWIYDYQITGAGQRISEQRTLLNENGHAMRAENAAPRTRIATLYGVLLPITYLAGENRSRYDYAAAEGERVGGRDCVVVDATPKPGNGGEGGARLWIDREDGSVLKIELETSAVKGFEALRDTATRMGARLEIRDVHEYGTVKEGLRFPSKTLFRELYVFDRNAPAFKAESYDALGEFATPKGSSISAHSNREMELTRIDIDYRNYRFFEVKTILEIRE